MLFPLFHTGSQAAFEQDSRLPIQAKQQSPRPDSHNALQIQKHHEALCESNHEAIPKKEDTPPTNTHTHTQKKRKKTHIPKNQVNKLE